ncbi:MAG: hypothetical protein QOD72_2895, partial [Acidimicrobiaceae bacterium]|nr:hypothetical protein [Acidimicrobiaceae bacterium]
PARSYYYRHDGIRRMNADVERAIGPSELHIDSVTVLDDGRVVTRGRQTRHAESGATSTVAFEAFCTLRDGLIISVESNTVDNG